MTKMDKNWYFDIERLRSIPISKVAERWGCHLKKAGSRWVTNCPWHDDKHPSLTLYETSHENRCHCFACGQGGTPIDFVMAKEGIDFKEACEKLAGTFGGRGFYQNEMGKMGKMGKAEKPEFPEYPENPESPGNPATPTPPPPTAYIPRQWLEAHVSAENSFSRCLLQMFNPALVDHLTEEYLLGCYDNGTYEDCVLFPSIDVEGRIRNVKVQHYCTDPHSERFAHADKRCCYWLGTKLAKEGMIEIPDYPDTPECPECPENPGKPGKPDNPENPGTPEKPKSPPTTPHFNNNCLFGEHLLRRYPHSVVALVESPKNALVGAAVQPRYVWVATGSKGMLKRSVLEVLQGRQVMVFPDRDALDDWKAALHTMRDIATFSVSDFSETFATQGDTKFDIADYVVAQWQRTRKPE